MWNLSIFEKFTRTFHLVSPMHSRIPFISRLGACTHLFFFVFRIPLLKDKRKLKCKVIWWVYDMFEFHIVNLCKLLVVCHNLLYFSAILCILCWMYNLIGFGTKKTENQYISERNKYKRALLEKSITLARASLGCTGHWIEDIEEHNPLLGSVA